MEEVILSFAGQVIVAQQALDLSYGMACADFKAFCEAVAPSAAASMAREFAPAHVTLEGQSIDCSFTTGSGTFSEIRLFNQVVQQRYRTRTATHSIHVEVRRYSPEPGQTIPTLED